MRVLITVPSLAREFGGPAAKAQQLAAALRAAGDDVIVVGAGEAPDGRSLGLPVVTRFHTTPVPSSTGALRRLVAGADVVHVLGFRDPVGTLAAREAERRGVPYVLEPVGMHEPRIRSLRLKRAFDRVLGDRVVGAGRRRGRDVAPGGRRVRGEGSRPGRRSASDRTGSTSRRWCRCRLVARSARRRGTRRRPAGPGARSHHDEEGSAVPRRGGRSARRRLARPRRTAGGGRDDRGCAGRGTAFGRRGTGPDRRGGGMGAGQGRRVRRRRRVRAAVGHRELRQRRGGGRRPRACPVVVCDRCGVAEWLPPASSAVVPYAEVAPLRAAIERLLSPEVRAAARREADGLRQALSWGGIAAAQRAIYLEVLAGSGVSAGTEAPGWFRRHRVGLIAVGTIVILAVVWVWGAGRVLVREDEPGTPQVVFSLSGDPLGDRLRAAAVVMRATGAERLVVLSQGGDGIYDWHEDAERFLAERGSPRAPCGSWARSAAPPTRRRSRPATSNGAVGPTWPWRPLRTTRVARAGCSSGRSATT